MPDYRGYSCGDDARFLDCNAYLRLGTLFRKIYQTEQHIPLQCCWPPVNGVLSDVRYASGCSREGVRTKRWFIMMWRDKARAAQHASSVHGNGRGYGWPCPASSRAGSRWRRRRPGATRPAFCCARGDSVASFPATRVAAAVGRLYDESEELREREVNAELLKQISQVTGGRYKPTVEQVLLEVALRKGLFSRLPLTASGLARRRFSGGVAVLGVPAAGNKAA